MFNDHTKPIVNLNIRNNADYKATIYWGAGQVQLSGLAARMDIKANERTSEVLLSLSSENGLLIIHVSEGYIEINLPYEVTSTIKWQRALFDMILYSTITNEVYFVAGGNVFVNNGITKI